MAAAEPARARAVRGLRRRARVHDRRRATRSTCARSPTGCSRPSAARSRTRSSAARSRGRTSSRATWSSSRRTGPRAELAGLARGFAGEIGADRRAARAASARACCRPRCTRGWTPRASSSSGRTATREIYAAFDRIFDCRGHGWANLQSAHLNLPFADDDEFGRLHAAVARAAAAPARARGGVAVRRRAPHRACSTRASTCTGTTRGACPSLTGAVVPEPVFTRADYEALLGRALRRPRAARSGRHAPARVGERARRDRALRPHGDRDPRARRAGVPARRPRDRVRRSRARCARCAIRTPAHQARLRALATAPLADLLARTTAQAERAAVDDAELSARARPRRRRAHARGRSGARSSTRHLASDRERAEHRPALEVLLEEGCLARRILNRVGEKPTREALAALYRELGDCLREGRLLPCAKRAERAQRRLACSSPASTAATACRAAIARCSRARAALLASHRGFDPGALDVARRLARAWRAPLVAATTTRLLVDLNRSPHNPAVFSAHHARRCRARAATRCSRAITARTGSACARRSPRAGRGVLHLAVHSFTPVLRGVAARLRDRDPLRPEAARASARSRSPGSGGSRARCPGSACAATRPTAATADGLTTALRRELPARRYLGIELELNQRLIASAAQRRALAAALAALLPDTATRGPHGQSPHSNRWCARSRAVTPMRQRARSRVSSRARRRSCSSSCRRGSPRPSPSGWRPIRPR